MAYRITKVYFFMLNIGDHVSAEGLLYISYRSAIWKSGAMERWPLNMMGFGFNPLCHLLAVRSCTTSLTCSSLCFFILKLGIIIVLQSLLWRLNEITCSRAACTQRFWIINDVSCSGSKQLPMPLDFQHLKVQMLVHFTLEVKL